MKNNTPKFISCKLIISSNSLDLSVFKDMPIFNELHFLPQIEWVIQFAKCRTKKIATNYGLAHGEYHFFPLFDYNGEYDMPKSEYDNFIKNAPVKFDQLLGAINKEKFTSEIIESIRNYYIDLGKS